MMQYVIKHKGCRQMALKAKNSDVTHFEKNNFPLLAKKGFRFQLPCYDKFSGHGYTSLPKPDESESGKMVLK